MSATDPSGKETQVDTVKITVRADWDDEAKVWVASSDDLPGLVTEAEELEGLSRKLPGMILDLWEPEQISTDPIADQVPIELIASLPRGSARAA